MTRTAQTSSSRTTRPRSSAQMGMPFFLSILISAIASSSLHRVSDGATGGAQRVHVEGFGGMPPGAGTEYPDSILRGGVLQGSGRRPRAGAAHRRVPPQV